MTFLQIINKVLIRLREAQVTTADQSDYSVLIGEFVNETKREVEDAHNWNSLRTTVTVNTVQGTTQYALTNAGKRFNILDVYETTTDSFLPRGNAIRMKKEIEEASQAQPTHYYIEGVDANGDLQMHVALTPDAVYTYNVHLKVPQAALTGSTECTMDEWPIILGAYSKALEERGEDQGAATTAAMSKYGSAVADAIALDIQMTKDEDEWYV